MLPTCKQPSGLADKGNTPGLEQDRRSWDLGTAKHSLPTRGVFHGGETHFDLGEFVVNVESLSPLRPRLHLFSASSYSWM